MSGTTGMPRASRISSASTVVGPFAASTMYFAFIFFAFSPVIWFSRAAGISMSVSHTRRAALPSAPAMNVPALLSKSRRSLCSALYLYISSQSSPSSQRSAPETSDTATTLHQSSPRSLTVVPPTLPLP